MHSQPQPADAPFAHCLAPNHDRTGDSRLLHLLTGLIFFLLPRPQHRPSRRISLRPFRLSASCSCGCETHPAAYRHGRLPVTAALVVPLPFTWRLGDRRGHRLRQAWTKGSGIRYSGPNGSYWTPQAGCMISDSSARAWRTLDDRVLGKRDARKAAEWSTYCIAWIIFIISGAKSDSRR